MPRIAVPLELLDLPGLSGTRAGRKSSFQLKDLLRALKRRRRLMVLVASSVLLLSLLDAARSRLVSPVYQGNFLLLISDPITNAGRNESGGMVESLARNRVNTDIPTLIQLLLSPSVLDPVAARFHSSPTELAASLAIEKVRGPGRNDVVDGVLNVTLRGRQPDLIRRQLDALSSTYLQEARGMRRLRLTEGMRFLDEQGPQLQQRVNLAQSQLADFRVRHALLQPEEEGAALKSESRALENEQRQLQAERARLLKLRAGVAAGQLIADRFSLGGGSGAADGVAVVQADGDLLNQLREAEQQLSQARSLYRPDHPRLRDLLAYRNQLRRRLRGTQLEAIDTALALSRTRQQAIAGQRRTVQGQFLRQPELIRQYEELQQSHELARESLASFLKTRENFKLELAQDTVPWRVIAPPSVGAAPVEPNVKDSLLKGVLLALAAGAAAGLIRDRLDHVFHHPTEVQEDLEKPLLGHIPHFPEFRGVRERQTFLLDKLSAPADSDDPEERRQQHYHRFFYQEAFRNLYTSLRFVNADRPVRSLALTSSLPSEGKSLVNALLAKTVADLGLKVLLVDADLRKPQLHHRLGTDNLVGLTNVLADDGLSWRDALHQVADYDNWWVLTAGPRAPDPARLFSSPRASQLVREIAEQGGFDLVLYDTPPVLGLADAPLLAEHLDGLILLVSLDRVDRALPHQAIDRIMSAGAPLLGLVTNAVTREEDSGSGGYGYGRYGYGYGYGYGYASYSYASDHVRRAYVAYGRDDEASAAPRPAPPPRGRQGWWRAIGRWIDEA